MDNPASGGTATPTTPQPSDRDRRAQAVLDRIIGEAPAHIGAKLTAGINGTHHRAIQALLDHGWQPRQLADTLAGRGWDSVHDPPKALLGRIRGVGEPPPANRPPPFEPSWTQPDHLETAAVAAEHVQAIRQQLAGGTR